MLMQVEYVEEIASSVPNAKRRFHVMNELVGIDPHETVAAKTFQGSIMAGKVDQDFETESPCHMVDLFLKGGFRITTIINDELMNVLFRNPMGIWEPKSRDETCGICGIEPEEKPTYLEPKELENRGGNN